MRNQINFTAKCEYVFTAFAQIYGNRWENHLQCINNFSDIDQVKTEWAYLLQSIPYAVIDRCLHAYKDSRVLQFHTPKSGHFIAICSLIAKRPYLMSYNPFFEMKEHKRVELAVI